MRKNVIKLLPVICLLCIVAFAVTACKGVKTVSFVVDGKTYATIDTSGNEIVTIPQSPAKDGYTFDGWYWDEGTWQRPFTADSLLNEPLTSNISVYAKFTNNEDEKVLHGVEIRSNIFAVTDESLYAKVPNSQETFSFINAVAVAENATYVVSADSAVTDVVRTKTVSLEIGDNMFYVLVENGSDKQLYTATIRRKPMYDVEIVRTNNDSVTVSVEEGSYLTNPQNLTRLGYEFQGWDFDFTKPITENTTIVAQWKANEYKVIYDANGGVLTDTQYTAKYGSAYTLAVPARELHTFQGWYINETQITDANGKSIKNWTYTEDKTVTARWTGNKYTVTYDANGGVLTDTQSTVTYDGAYTLAVPSREGHTFQGWYIDETQLTDANGQSVNNWTYTEDKTVTALWTVNEYTVTLDYHGATSGNETKTLTVTYGQAIGALPVPAKTGYAFAGWQLNGEDITSATVWKNDGNATVNAVYTANRYAAIYNANGGVLTDTQYTVTYDGAYILAVPAREGHTFQGWYIDETQLTDANGRSVNNWTYTEDKTVTAHWTVNEYTVTLDYDGATSGNETETLNVTYGQAIGALPAPAKKGYSFAGWQLNGEDITSATVWKNDCDATVNAVYTANRYIATYDINGGVLTDTQSTVTYDGAYTLAVPAREGHTFQGWYIDETQLTDANGQSVNNWMYAEDKTVTALWNVNSYVLTITNSNSNAGTVTGDGTKVYNSDVTVTATELNLGYDWLGWYDGDTLISANLSYSFTMPANTLSLTARYSLRDEMSDFNFTSTSTTCTVTGVKNNTVTDITIPEYVTTIGNSAFYGCSKLANINYLGTIESWCKIQGLYYLMYNGSGTRSKTLSINGEQVTGDLVIPSTVTSIPSSAFYNCDNITSVTISDRVTSIGYEAFYSCSSLMSIKIPNSVTSIGTDAFSGCSSLANVIFADNSKLTGISDFAFQGCGSLTSIKIPNSVTSIGSRAFHSCSSLIEIVIPSSVTSIGSCAFQNCGSLESINVSSGNAKYHSAGNCLIETKSKTLIIGCKNSVIPTDGSVTSIDDWAFSYCRSLTEIVIPSSVTSICISAFRGCSSLANVIFADNSQCKSIDSDAFYDCSSLTEIVIPSSVTSINSGVFSSKLKTVYYAGTADDWAKIEINNIGNYYLTNATRYYYSENEPAFNADSTAYNGNYWHFVDGVVTVWKKDA